MYLFNRYYSKGGTKNIPYFSALCAVVFIIYVHIFQILIVLNRVNVLGLNKAGDMRIEKYSKLALFLLPVFLIVAFLVKPNDLKELSYEDDKIRRGNIYLIGYVICNFLLLFLLMFAIPKK